MSYENDKRLWSLAQAIMESLAEKSELQQTVVQLQEIVAQQDAEIRALQEDRSYVPQHTEQDDGDGVIHNRKSLVEILSEVDLSGS